MEEAAALGNMREEDMDVHLSKGGDKEAFGRIINRNKFIMYKVARGILYNPQDIEDAIGDAILKAFLNIGTLKNNSNFKPWLLKILVNECYSLLRKRKREVFAEDIPNDFGSFEDNYSNFELMHAIDQLEEEHRVVTLLFYYEDMSLKDISKVLELPEGTVKSRLSRAKKKLEGLLKD